MQTKKQTKKNTKHSVKFSLRSVTPKCWCAVVGAALALAVVASLLLKFMDTRYTVAYVERADGESLVYKYNPSSNNAKKIFSTPYNIIDVIVKNGKYYYATTHQLYYGSNSAVMPENCTLKDAHCRFGFIDGKFVMRYAKMKGTKVGYELDMKTFALLDSGSFSQIDAMSLEYRNLQEVRGELAVLDVDFDDGVVSLVRQALNPNNYKYAERAGYSGFFRVVDSGNLSGKLYMYDKDGVEHEKTAEISVSVVLDPAKLYQVFDTPNYKFIVEAKNNLEGWLLSDTFVIAADKNSFGMNSSSSENATVITLGEDYVLYKYGDWPYKIIDAHSKGDKIFYNDFEPSVSLAGFVRF